MSLTTDPTHPDLTRGVDDAPILQAKVYLVLSEEERAKGFIRPVRYSYQHVGIKPKYPTRALTPEEIERYGSEGYILYEIYPEDKRPLVGKFWTAKQLNSGCGTVTTVGKYLWETYARNPKFYGSTYCVGCSKHCSVEEFVWTEEGEVVGSLEGEG